MTVLSVKPATVTLDGQEYQIELGRIRSTMLGYEGHGIFTFVLDMDFGGTGQGAGSYNLNQSKYVGFFVKRVLDIVGANSWEELTNRSVFVLRTEHNDIIKGLMNASQSKVVLFSDIYIAADKILESDNAQ